MSREKGEGEKPSGKNLRKSQEVDRVGTGEKKTREKCGEKRGGEGPMPLNT